MKEYIIRRILLVIPIAFGVASLVFLLIHLIPGDPVVIMLGETAQPADIEHLRKLLHLDEPLYSQYLRFIKNIISGSLGVSIKPPYEKVSKIIFSVFPNTIILTVSSLLFALLFSFPLGIISALKANKLTDKLASIFSLIGISMPNFWLGPLLIILFSIKLNLLPVSGFEGPQYLILPSITLGTALMAILVRMIRSSLLEVMGAEYVVTARAKGVSEFKIIWKHCLKNALIPVITIVGLQFGALLGGSIITETIFSWPGIGTLIIEAIRERNYPVVQGSVFILAMCFVLVNLLTDILYAIFDPRIKYT